MGGRKIVSHQVSIHASPVDIPSTHSTDVQEHGASQVTELEELFVGEEPLLEGQKQAPVSALIAERITPETGVHAEEKLLFGIEIQDYSGRLNNTRLFFEYNFTKNFGLGFGIERYSFEVNAETDDFLGELDISYSGGSAYLKGQF